MTSTLIVPVTFPDGCNMTLTGLEIPEGLKYDEWQGVGELLGQARRRKELELQAILWAIGDWLTYGEARYGEKYGQAVQEFGRTAQTLMNLAWVAGKVEPDRRRMGLSHAHHSAVAALPPPDADALLDMAEMENATSTDLRNLVRAKQDRASGKVPEEENARRALERARTALADVNKRHRAQLVIDHLVSPLAAISNPDFLDAITKGCERRL